MSQSQRFIPKPLSIRALVGLTALLVSLVMVSSAAALPAPNLFMTTGGIGNSSVTPPPSNLWQLDPNTGGATSLGNTGYAIGALAQDPTTGILYAASNNKSPIAPNTLLTINPANGAATAIGSLGEFRVSDMTFDASGKLVAWVETDDVFASIDKNTGAVTVIGPEELSTYGGALAFDLTETLWLFGEGEGKGTNESNEGQYYAIDPLTGKATLRGKLIPLDENESAISAAAYDCARTTLYGTVNNFGEPPANLVTINTATGSLSNKGLIPTGADGLEWYCPLAFEYTSGPIKVAAKKQTLTFGVVRGPRIKGAASVNFATVNGSAKAGTDFVAAAGTLGFANNAADGTVSVTVKGDPKAGKNRKFEIALSSPSSGGSVGAPVQITILAAKPKPATVKGPKQSSSDRPVFTLKSKQLPARFRCKLDKGKFKGCGKNSKKGKKYKTPQLAPGKHTLKVQVVNGAGKKSKPAKKVFTVLP